MRINPLRYLAAGLSVGALGVALAACSGSPAHHPLAGETGCPESRSQVRSAPRCAEPGPGATVDAIGVTRRTS